MKPLLSLVACGRNDSYGGNFLWRLETAINFSAERLSAIDRLDDVEFVIVDWGSSRPLHEVLALTDHSRRICRFLIVPPSVTKAYDAESGFAGTVAMNVGIRRSRGSYIAQTGGDILYDRDSLTRIFDLLEGKTKAENPVTETLFFLGLKNIPYDIVSASPDIGYLERYLSQNRLALSVQTLIPYLYGGAAAVLAHRNRWFEARGLDETMVYWGWSDIDLKLRMCLKYSAQDIGRDLGIFAYHLSHLPPGSPPNPADKNRKAFNPFVVNDAHWGISEYRFDESPPGPPLDAPFPAPEPTPMDPGWYRLKHFSNLLRFAISHPDKESLKFSWVTLHEMIMDLPDENTIKRIFYLGKAAVKRSIPPRKGP